MSSILTNSQLSHLIDFRQQLHRRPDLSGYEQATAQTVLEALRDHSPDQIVTNLGSWEEPDGIKLGGTGIGAVYDSGIEGPTLLFRCELDGLPIEEISTLSYRSELPTKAHLCGHDGHMAILMGLAMRLSNKRPARGRVVLMFQPAEETGKGARAVLADPAFQTLMPDFAYALHNIPGVKLGEVLLKSGAMCCASRGMRIRFEGKTSHASMPQDGASPVEALMAVVAGLKAMTNGLNPDQELDDSFKLTTITHMSVGEPCFGVSPAQGELWVTLRTVTDEAMDELVQAAHDLALSEASHFGLAISIEQDDIFDACTNAQMATDHVAQALEVENIPYHTQPDPMRFSEDFGQFGQHCPSALFLLGSGEKQPQLHNPDFDFPDDLISVGARLFERIARQQLG